jgi:hypothetical protein
LRRCERNDGGMAALDLALMAALGVDLAALGATE